LRTDDTNSVTGWIRGLGTSRHEDASKLIWDRYFARIARLAHGRLRSISRGPADGEDVALSVFDSFFLLEIFAAQAGALVGGMIGAALGVVRPGARRGARDGFGHGVRRGALVGACAPFPVMLWVLLAR
jgi:hypothetical protein